MSALTISDHWRTQLSEHRRQLQQAFSNGLPVRRLLAQQCAMMDNLLRELWHTLALPESAALVAVGGYGRKELFPYSDIDLLILLAQPPQPNEQALLEQLIGLFWDVGLEVGHSVRTVDECLNEAERDLTVQTNLLESRFLTGNTRLYLQFRHEFLAQLNPRLFFEGKLSEQDQRHARYNDSSNQLEPNLKESPGGLRDLNNLRWMAQAIGIGNRWQGLVTVNLLKTNELRQLQRVERQLFTLRARLHYLAGRRDDRLLFNYQSQLAEQYHIQLSATRRASELLMQQYYLATRFVAQMRDIVLPSLRAHAFGSYPVPVLPINARFEIRDNQLAAIQDDLFEREPHAIFESFLLLQQHSQLSGMSAATLRALWRSRTHIDQNFRCDPVNRQLFMQILRTPYAITRTLRNLNRYDVLGRYIPMFGRIVGQMQHDLYHIYTVDEHILTVLRNLRRLTIPELAHEYPLSSRLISGFDKPELLYLAALFHDIAKGRGGDHSDLGKIDAKQFCQQHGLPDADTHLVVWLVQEHLSFSSTAQKQDLSDPDVILRFRARIPDERYLTALYLLTVCDIRGTSPTVWNGWKAKLIDDLFYATRRLLAGDCHTQSRIDLVKSDAARMLRLYGLSPGTENALWTQLNDSYFLRHEPNDIAWHCRQLWKHVVTEQPVVKARPSPTGEGIQTMIYMPDEPSLFARICSFFDHIQYTIVDAQIHTSRHGYALDSFVVLDQHQHASTYRDFLNYIEHELTLRLQLSTPLKAHGRVRISRQLKHFPLDAEVNLRPDERGQFYALNLTAGDRPGLLFSIAQLMFRHNIHLHSAKISTLGERAEDTFMIHGEALEHPQTRLKLETDLLQMLNV